MQFAETLQRLFPAVEAKSQTWESYARAFVSWFRYAGLVSVLGEKVTVGPNDEERLSLIAGFGRPARTPGMFPQGRPEAVRAILRYLMDHDKELALPTREFRRGISDGLALGVIDIDDDGVISATALVLDREGELIQTAVLKRLEAVGGGSDALDLLGVR